MAFHLDSAVKTILSHPSFMKLQAVVENNSYHEHESVYDHLLKTFTLAKEKATGNFIKNTAAQKAFQTFTEKTTDGVTKKDMLILTALLHDIGKCLSYTDNNKTYDITLTLPDGTTRCPGHEYQGSLLIPTILEKITLPQSVLSSIENVIRLHDTFNEDYFRAKQQWHIQDLVTDAKTRAETFYLEALFNMYCDCYTAKPFQFAIPFIEKLFHEPSFYTPRKYFVA